MKVTVLLCWHNDRDATHSLIVFCQMCTSAERLIALFCCSIFYQSEMKSRYFTSTIQTIIWGKRRSTCSWFNHITDLSFCYRMLAWLSLTTQELEPIPDSSVTFLFWKSRVIPIELNKDLSMFSWQKAERSSCWDFWYGKRLTAAGVTQKVAEGGNWLLSAKTIYTDPLCPSNPHGSSEPQVCPICIVSVFQCKSVDLNILWGLEQLSSMSNAMIRDFWLSW